MPKNESLTQKEYLLIKAKAYRKYKQIESVECPYLKREVVFNSNGFRHIIYKSKNKKRHINTQLLRFNLLDKAVELIANSNTLQEYESIKAEVSTKDHGVSVIKIKKTEYFGFIGIINGWKIKVIVKRIGNGNPIFWSVIPNWTTNKKRDGNFKKYLNHTGNLKED